MPPFYAHTHKHTHTYLPTCTYIYTFLHKHVCAHTHTTLPYACAHTYLLIHMPQYICTHMCIHTRAHTHILIPPSWGKGLSWSHYFFPQNFLKMFLVYGGCRFGILEPSFKGLGLLVVFTQDPCHSRNFTAISKKEKLCTVLPRRCLTHTV